MFEKKSVFKHSLVIGIVFVVLIAVLAAPVYAKAKAKKRRPAKPKITSVKASSNTIKVKIKKVKTARKYQIAYRMKSAGKWTKKIYKKSVYTIKKCRYGTKYQIKVRAYNGRWGKWSIIKTCTTPSKIRMTSLQSVGETPKTTNQLTDNYGNSYKFAITNYQGYSGSSKSITYEYLLNAKYKLFTGTLYIPSGERHDRTSALIVKGDGHVLYTSPALNKVSYPLPFKINVTGVKDLVVEWTNNSTYNYSELECCLGNGYFYYSNPGDKNIDLNTMPIALTDLKSISSVPKYTTFLTDIYGNQYIYAIDNYVDLRQKGTIPVFEYLLNSRYKRLTGILYVPPGIKFTYSYTTMMVYADGKEIYTSPEMSSLSGPVRFNINITNCNDLEITFSEAAFSTEDMLCLAYTYLYY